MPREHRDGKLHFTVESMEGRHIRPGLAKAVVESGWELNELHAVGLSLEEIFLQLTASPEEHKAATAVAEPVGEAQ
jgi:ABC-2 type transport system ATP-binding protein